MRFSATRAKDHLRFNHPLPTPLNVPPCTSPLSLEIDRAPTVHRYDLADLAKSSPRLLDREPTKSPTRRDVQVEFTLQTGRRRRHGASLVVGRKRYPFWRACTRLCRSSLLIEPCTTTRFDMQIDRVEFHSVSRCWISRCYGSLG